MLTLRKWAAYARAQLILLVLAIRARLIEDLRASWKLWSVQFAGLALIIQSLMIGAPDAALAAWNALPDELKALLPVHYANIVAAALTALGLAARVVKQKAPADAG